MFRIIEKWFNAEHVTIDRYEDLPPNDANVFLQALANQPLSVAIDASSADFRLYSGGVLSGPDCGTYMNHGVVAVGFGSEGGTDYIIAKNSWGTQWGEEGYIRFQRTTGQSSGQCGIYQMVAFPIKDR